MHRGERLESAVVALRTAHDEERRRERRDDEAAMREETALSGRWGIRGGLTAYQRADLARQQNRCVECGAPFDKTRTNRLTCSEECAEVRHARSKRAWSARRSWGADKEATA